MKKPSLARQIIDEAVKKKLMIATCESCTGGLVAMKITKESGAAQVLDRGFITYSNFAKNEMLDVPLEIIYKNGAVSEEVAEAMAQGGLKKSRADIVISITGLAGPTGATENKPIGLVYFALATNKQTKIFKKIFGVKKSDRKNIYSRNQIQNLSANFALKLLLKEIVNY